MPSRGDYSSKRTNGSLRRVNVEMLRVKLPRKIDDLLFADRDRAELIRLPSRIVFKEPLIGWHRKCVECHQFPLDLVASVFFLAFAARSGQTYKRIFPWNVIACASCGHRFRRSGLGRKLDFFKGVSIQDLDQPRSLQFI